MAPGEHSISVEGLSKRFGDIAAVLDLTMRVRHGEIFGFLGPNGSGKTTSIRMMCGLLTPDAGRGQCLGFDIRTEANEIKQRVGYMTQKFSLYEDLSIRENLDFVARMYAVQNRRTVVERTIERLGLSERRDQLVGTLSGGWKQRLALAACLLHGPRLLLLDEPTASVDPKARRDFWEEIHALAAEGVSVLVSTHYMDEAKRCHRLAYIFGGPAENGGSRRPRGGGSAGRPALSDPLLADAERFAKYFFKRGRLPASGIERPALLDLSHQIGVAQDFDRLPQPFILGVAHQHGGRLAFAGHQDFFLPLFDPRHQLRQTGFRLRNGQCLQHGSPFC